MPYHLLYDEECALCVQFQQEIARWDVHRRITPVGFKDPRIGSLVPRMNRDQLQSSFHLVLLDGSVLSGPRAMPTLLRLLPGLRWAGWLLTWLPFGGWLSDRIYARIVSHRK